MSLKKRIELIKKIERIRGSKVITYIVSDRENIATMIEESDVREFHRHIGNSKHNKIDLFIYSLGGDATVAWRLGNLFKESSKGFAVLVPFKAFSCATAIAISANNIIMHKMGCLGPVDPLVGNPYNPEIRGKVRSISVEDVAGFLSFIKENFGIKNQEERIIVKSEDTLIRTFEKLCEGVHPLALGNVYRHYMKARDDTRKLLELNFDPDKDKEKIDNIIEILVEKLYYHGHHVNRKEAKNYGLNVIFPENISNGKEFLSDIIWELYLEYEKDLSLETAYVDELPRNGNKREIPIKFIESNNLSSRMVIEQEFVDMGLPEGTIPSMLGNQTAVLLPNTQQPVPIHFSATPVFLNNKIYEKKEKSCWKQKNI